MENFTGEEKWAILVLLALFIAVSYFLSFLIGKMGWQVKEGKEELPEGHWEVLNSNENTARAKDPGGNKPRIKKKEKKK